MMTFLPFDDFDKSAKSLDNKRLLSQMKECHQILNAINGETKGWVNHPATLMWKPYVPALKYYTNCIIREWLSRGFNLNAYWYHELPECIVLPWWLGLEALHESHKAMLLRKKYDHYIEYFNCDPFYYDKGYVWPSKAGALLYDRENDIYADIPKTLIDMNEQLLE